MNERDGFLRLLAALIPLGVLLYLHNQYQVDRAAAQVVYRVRLASWRWRVWRRLDQDQRQRYVELHGDPG